MMNITATTSLILATSLFTDGCASRPDPAPVYNPMPQIWASTAGGIKMLKEINATRAQWTKGASETKRITTLTELRQAIAALGNPADDAERQRRDEKLEQLFRTSHRTFQFGWDCDFSAIVFFDSSGHPKHVELNFSKAA